MALWNNQQPLILAEMLKGVCLSSCCFGRKMGVCVCPWISIIVFVDV